MPSIKKSYLHNVMILVKTLIKSNNQQTLTTSINYLQQIKGFSQQYKRQ